MAKDKKEKKSCPSCSGAGGSWEVPNGDRFAKRVWRQCRLCSGSGKV